MSNDEKKNAAIEVEDTELDSVSAGATWGQGSVTTGKESLLIQNIGFPDDQSGGREALGDKGNVLLNPSRTYKGK